MMLSTPASASMARARANARAVGAGRDAAAARRRDGTAARRRVVATARARSRDVVVAGGGGRDRRCRPFAARGEAQMRWASDEEGATAAAARDDDDAEDATAEAEVRRLTEEIKEVTTRLGKAQTESEDGEAQAKALAEQAVLATEACAKDEELASSAMNSAKEANQTLMEATALAEALGERVRKVEQGVTQARLVPTDDGSENGEEILDQVSFKRPGKESEAESAARQLGVLSESWWEKDDLTLRDALVRVTQEFESANFARKEAQAELKRRESFAEEAVQAAQRSKQLSLAAHDNADAAMEKIAVKMQAVVTIREILTTLEKQRAEQQALIDGVDAAEAQSVEVAGQVSKSKADIQADIDAAAAQELAEKRAVAQEEEEESDDASSTKKSSKFLTAGYFSSAEREESAEATVLKKALVSMLLLGSAALMLPVPMCKAVRSRIGATVVQASSKMKSETHKIRQQTNELIERVVPASERELAVHAAHEAEETGMTDVLWLLFTSVFAVTLVSKIPGGSPVLGFLLGGALVGPFGLGIITHVEQVKVLAEFGVVFLLFNIGLELSYDRLVSMSKYIFGLGSSQMMLSTAVGAAIAVACGLAVPPAVIVGLGLAFSSTAVAMQVLADRGESASRHGRATFSVLLFQDLTVVLVFMLVPLLAGPDSGSLTAIGASLLKAIVKTGAAIVTIIGLGRVVLRPVFDRVAKLRQAELMSATTLFFALGTSLLTQALGLSMELGAFLAGLLLAETEFHLQVENDIAPFRGLLLGLFFMTVGMTIDPMTFYKSAGNIIAMMTAIVIGKIAVVAAVGPLFGLSLVNCIRAGLYIGPGGEFAFVTFGEAVRVGLFSATLATQLNLAVVLTMAITPYLAQFGNNVKNILKSGNAAGLQPKESEVDDLKGHVIIAGYGRNGKIIGEILRDNMIPFVALDVNPEVVSAGRAADQNVYFGDAGSPEVLKAIGAERASCAIVALSSPAANYRTVWALSKNFSNVQTYVRADDVEGGLILEKAGAKAVVPEALEPSLQLAAACLREQKMTPNDITIAIDSYRRSHLKSLSSSPKFSAAYSTIDYAAIGSMDQSEDETSLSPA